MARMRGIHADVIRGSIGGNTFFSNPYHQICIRQRTAPVQPNTTYQSQVRAAFGGAAVDWNALTPGERDRWEAYATTCSFQGPLGSYKVPGRTLFLGAIGQRRYAQTRGIVILLPTEDPPELPGWLSMDPITIVPPVAPDVGFQLSVGNPNPEDVWLLAERSVALNPARNTYKGPWLSPSYQGVAIATATTGTMPFYNLIDGMAYFVRFRILAESGPHRYSEDHILRAVAATGVI